MTAFKSYFKSHLKQSTKPLIFIFVISVIFTLIISFSYQIVYGYKGAISYKSTLYGPVIVLVFLSYILPVMEFAFFKKRINLNCAYSLPISRRAMGAVHFLTGAITLVGAFTASYLSNFIMMLVRGAEHYFLPPIIPHYFLCVLLGLASYAFMVFVFCEANTKGDGIWFMILWTFALILVSATAQVILDVFFFDYQLCAVHWGLIDQITTNIQCLVESGNSYYSYSPEEFFSSPETWGWVIWWTLVGVASTVGLYLTFGKRRMEKTEEISDSYFGYRMLIPLFAITGNIVFDDIFFWITIEILALIGYTIYRRGFHYKKSDIIILIGLILFLFI